MNQIDLKGKNAIVTGAARGIGLAVVERFLASGARCSLWDANEGRLRDTAAKLAGQGEVDAQAVNVANPEACENAARAVVHRFGSVDILVNCAGIAGVTKKAWEFTPEEWTEVIHVNLIGVYFCCRAVIPHMIERKYGRIVNIASIAGKEGNPNASHYSAAKAGVIGLTKSLGKELAQAGVLVNCITPAVIDTEILHTVPQSHIDYMISKIPMGRVGQREEVAAMIAWLSSADCSFSTGAVFDLSGGRATY